MKKFLSLAMALAMVLSLFTMTSMASAADFTDDDSINYVEAVDVISAIKVIDGYTDGSFKPTEALTRGAAAKIITNMILGPSTASTLIATAAPFPDVPANHTFAPYIAYCAQNGIINGYADGTFAPSGRLTGFAFLKMLLGALGYDGSIEGFTGANWSIQVAKIADGIGLTEDLMEGFSGTDSVDRQTACLFAFNTLKADLVEYDNVITANVGGVNVAIGGNNIAHSKTAQTQASQANAYNIVREQEDSGNYLAIVQFAEEYFPRLVRNDKNFRYNAEYADLVKGNAGVDAMGRPATTWVYNGEKIGTYCEEADATYNGNKKLNEIYSDLGMSSAAADVFVYLNGIKVAEKDYTTTDSGKTYTMGVSRGNDAKIGDFKTQGLNKVGDGTIVEAYRNAYTNEVIISCQSVYGGKVASVHAANSKKDDFVRLDWGSAAPTDDVVGAGVGIESSDHNEFETTAFAEDDVVAFTYSEQDGNVGIQSMYKMESVTGSLTRYTVEKNLTLGDTVYKYAKEYSFSNGITAEGQLSNRSSYVVYLDANGYALWIEEDEFSPDAYAVILRITAEDADGIVVSDPVTDQGTGVWDGNRARLLFSDGTTRTVELNNGTSYLQLKNPAPRADAVSRFEFQEAYRAGQIIRWRVNDKGAYVLSKNAENSTEKPLSDNGFEIKDHEVLGFKDGIKFDSKTLFVINDNGDYVTYVGIRNVPDVSGITDAKSTVYAYVKEDVCKVLFISSSDATVIGSSKSVTFLAGASRTKLVTEGDTEDYYSYNAVVRGEITTVNVKAEQDKVMKQGTLTTSKITPEKINKKANIMLNQTSYDNDDLLRWADYSGSAKDGTTGEQGIRRVGNYEVRIGTVEGGGNMLLTVAENADIFYIDDGGEIEEITYSGITTSTKVDVYWVMDDGEIVSLFICEQ